MAATKTQTNVSVIEMVNGSPRCRVVYSPIFGAEAAVDAATRKAETIRKATGNVVEVRAIENQPVR